MYFLGIGPSSSIRFGTDNLHLKLKISYVGHFGQLVIENWYFIIHQHYLRYINNFNNFKGHI